jgi:ABC-2 type transport system permease protein
MSAAAAPDNTRDRDGGDTAFGFWRRTYAMLVKEFIQLRRDRVSFAMIVMIPVMQLLLFGYAINTNPRNLPTAVLLQEDSDLGRSVLKALQNSAYFRFTQQVHDVDTFDNLLKSGKVLFGVEIPRGFERAMRRGDHPALLVAADATEPVAAGAALSTLGVLVQTALVHDLHAGDPPSMPFEIRAHARYNPAASSRLNIVPGLVGHPDRDHADLHRAVGNARNRARHHGKPAVDADQAGRDHVRQRHPYVLVGFIQATLIIGIGVLLFGVPIRGSLILLTLLTPCSSPPIWRSATPSPPSCRTSCRRCKLRVKAVLATILLFAVATVIGDTVNFAARLESLNKDFASQLLISADVRDALGEACSDAVALGAVPIKGYDQPQTVWKLG